MSETISIRAKASKLTRPVAGLRWIERPKIDGMNLIIVRVLQQAWEVIEYDKDDRARTVAIEWRDVPFDPNP